MKSSLHPVFIRNIASSLPWQLFSLLCRGFWALCWLATLFLASNYRQAFFTELVITDCRLHSTFEQLLMHNINWNKPVFQQDLWKTRSTIQGYCCCLQHHLYTKCSTTVGSVSTVKPKGATHTTINAATHVEAPRYQFYFYFDRFNSTLAVLEASLAYFFTTIIFVNEN